jgi:ADP-ribose pyrophosphatase YjhB (NUDIX family)
VRRGEKFLCVWNKRAGGWSFPGGLVEPTGGAGDGAETCPHAVRRELREETGLIAVSASLVYIGHTNTAKPGRANTVYLYDVDAPGEALLQEEGAPLTLLSEAEFLEQSPFAMFYARAFGAIEERRRTTEHLAWLAASRAQDDAKVQAWKHAVANLAHAYHVKENR